MNTNNKLGITLINGMKKLTLKQAKNLMLASFSLYKNMILANQKIPPSPWFHFHDLVALMWGYYGDLDLHYEKMENRLIKTVNKFRTRSDLEMFVQSVGDYKERYDEHLKEIRLYYNCINIQ